MAIGGWNYKVPSAAPSDSTNTLFVGGVQVNGTLTVTSNSIHPYTAHGLGSSSPLLPGNPFDYTSYSTVPTCVGHELDDVLANDDGSFSGRCVNCDEGIRVERIPGGMPVVVLEQLLVRMDEDVDTAELAEALFDCAVSLEAEAEKLKAAQRVLQLAREELERRMGA